MASRQPSDALAPWFNPLDDGQHGRRALTRERVLTEARPGGRS